MRTHNLILGIFGAAILFSGCSTMKVATDYDKEAKFTEYKTYRVAQNEIQDPNTALVFNDLNRDRIERSLETKLETFGLNKADQPDVIVSYSMGTEVRKNYSTSATHTDMGGRWRGRYWGGSGMGSTQSTTQEYNTVDGQLLVSLTDARSNKLIWYGAVSHEITGNGKKAEKRIHDAIEKIFESFPMEKNLPEDGSGEGITLNE